MNKGISKLLIVFLPILIGLFFLYLFYINLSSDTIILFLSNKIFLGNWLRLGIYPFFNPYIFAGTPFLFDPGMGNLHPFNLFFLFQYPYSFAFWVCANFVIFVVGFYLFFSFFSKSRTFSIFLVLLLFLSGNGFWRMNNPTIFAVISHYGLFFYSLSMLKNTKKLGYLFSIAIGLLMTLSGHFQFVLFGFLFGAILVLFIYKVPIVKVIKYYALQIFSVSWYVILSLPIILESTRLTDSLYYVKTGALNPLHIIQLALPFIFGVARDGSSWNIGPKSEIVISLFWSFFIFILIIKKRISMMHVAIIMVLLFSSFGLINIPFLRGAGQIFILIHIFVLILIAKNEAVILDFLGNIKSRFILYLTFFIALILSFFCFSKLFIDIFFFIKKSSLFFDYYTVKAIGQLAGSSLLLLSIGIGIIIISTYIKKKYIIAVLLIYVIVEGFVVNFRTTYFIPNDILNLKPIIPKKFDLKNYRLLTASDVVPYFGFHTYMSDHLFRPPFSKEKPIFDAQEQKDYRYLQNIFEYIPSTWGMTAGIKTIQAYNTFVPKNLADYFTNPSADYESVYSHIISRNSYFKTNDKGTQINSLESSRITLNDPRWKNLSVKYYISNNKIGKYKLVEQSDKYFYEDPKANPIYRLISKNDIELFPPFSENPNEMQFNITKNELGKTLAISINPKGFQAKINNQSVQPQKEKFDLKIKLTKIGVLKVNYSPLLHLKETSIN